MTPIRPLSLCLLLALVSCQPDDPKESPPEPTPAETPKTTLFEVIDALDTGDGESLSELVEGPAEVRELFQTLARTSEVGDRFQQKFIEAYGPETWVAFQAPRAVGPKEANFTLTIPNYEEMKKRAAEWEESSENTEPRFSLMPGFRLAFKMSDQGWMIDGDAIFDDLQSVENLVASQKKLADFVESYLPAIGYEGISPEDLDFQMGKEILKAMGNRNPGASDAPELEDRFDLEAIKAETTR